MNGEIFLHHRSSQIAHHNKAKIDFLIPIILIISSNFIVMYKLYLYQFNESRTVLVEGGFCVSKNFNQTIRANNFFLHALVRIFTQERNYMFAGFRFARAGISTNDD